MNKIEYDFEKWVACHNKYNKKLTKILDNENNIKNKSKCLSALEVMATSMQDINKYIINKTDSIADFYQLIRNIDVYISSLITIHSILFGTSKHPKDSVIEQIFKNPNIIYEFRDMRSLILAHPIDTRYKNNNKQIEYLGMIINKNNPVAIQYKSDNDYDFILKKCKPDTELSYFDKLSIDKDIIPVINELYKALINLNKKTKPIIT